MNCKEKIHIGIIGLQGYGGTYFAVLSQLNWVEITAVCDTKKEAADICAKKYGISYCFTDYKEMLRLSKIDAVFIATPHFLHYQMTLDALAAGKNVFCEKPLALNSCEAQEMVTLAETKGLLMACHYNRRQSSIVKLLRDVIDRQILGEIYAVNVKWMARYTPFMFSRESAWRTEKKKAGGGILIGRGSHMIDAVLYILGAPEVQSVSANISSKLTGLEVDDYCLIVLRLGNGSSVTIECSYENNIPQFSEKIEYQFFGTKAGAYGTEEDGTENVQIGYCRFPQNEWVDLSGQFRVSDYRAMAPESIIVDFLEAIRDDRKPSCDGRTAAYVTSIIDMAYMSAREGREVRVEEEYVSERV